MNDWTFSTQSVFEIAQWAAEECERQRSGERSVGWMVQGWQYACDRFDEMPTVGDLLNLGAIVEPRHNQNGFRKVNVQVGYELVETRWQDVQNAVHILLNQWEHYTAELWFQAYETIHPFRDGNGRTGAILYNWHAGTLTKPQTAPMYRRPSAAELSGLEVHPGTPLHHRWKDDA